jgi:pimeloyl-ACP methyl ester carboxylesterase
VTALLSPLDQTIPPWPGRMVSLLSGVQPHVRATPFQPLPESGNQVSERAVYVHGLGGSATNWTDLANLLSPLVEGEAVDLPGFGRSPSPDGDDWSQAHQITTLIEYLEFSAAGRAPQEVPVHLIGNSMGGAAAIVVAAARPDLVRTLTLISPAVPDLRVVAQLRRSPMPLLLLPGLTALAERQLARMSPQQRVAGTISLCVADASRVPRHRIDEAIAEAAYRSSLPWSVASGTQALRGLVRSHLRFGAKSMWALAARIQAPTLVIWGDQDRLVDVDRAPRLVAAIPEARLLVLEGVGHVAMIEDPLRVAEAVAQLIAD